MVDLLNAGPTMPLSQLLKSSSSELQAELQLILNAVVEGLCGVDARGNTTFCNAALLKMTGYRADELIGKNLHELLHHTRPDGTRYPKELCPLRNALIAQEEIHGVSDLFWRKDGTAFTVEYWAHPMPQASRLTSSVVTILDITEREQATEALRTSEQRLRLISNNIDQAFYLVDVNASRLVYASPAFETITGVRYQEAHHKPSPWQDLALPEHRERVRAGYDRLLAGEEARDEYRIRHRDGSIRWIKDRAKPIRDASGRVSMFAGVAEDVTEIHNARDGFHQSEEKFRRILSSVPDVAWTSDCDRRTTYISPKVEAILGYTPKEFCAGANFRSGLIHPEDFGRVNQSYRALFENERPFDVEYRIRRKDGSWAWIHDRSTGTHKEKGVLYADGVFTDITGRKNAEAELQWKTAFLEAQANSTIDGILVVDGNGRRLLQNQRLVELFEVPPALLANKDDGPMLNHMASLMKDQHSFLARIKQLYKHPTETGRDEIALKDGRVMDRYSAPVVGSDQTYYGRIWTFRDITESKRNADMLQQLYMAVEQSPVSVVITDPRGKVSYVNHKFTECTGYSSEEAIGQTPRILKSGVVSPDIYRNLWSTIKQGQEWRGEFCNKKKNGELYWEAATIRPITDSKGNITHFLAVKEDITERRRVEKELRLTKFSLENASFAVYWMDPQARIVYANEAACRFLGRPREEILSLSIPDIDPGCPIETWEEFWQECKTQGSITIETQHRKKQGRVFPVEVTANYLEFDGKEYCFSFVRDITERRELEGQLRQAQKLEGIGQLAAGIAHEINTPTQFVADNLTFLRDSWKSAHDLLERYRGTIRTAAPPLPAGVIEALDEAERTCDLKFIVEEVPRAIEQSLDGAHRVAEIVRAMKEFSHPDSVEKAATDLNKAIQSTITVARNEWKYVADIAIRFDETLPAVVCYPGDINQVILNLLVNAAHAIKEKIKDGEKGKITVCTRLRGDFVEISVTDTGTGVPDAIRTRIFDPFFTTKEVGKGTGQGLSLAHIVIVKKHGGKIWFETEMDRGTTFFIDLPIQPPGSAREN